MINSIKSQVHYHYSNNYKRFLKKPEDFIVREIINQKFLRKYQRTNKGMKKVDKYTLFLLKKKNMTTEDAIKNIAKTFHIDINKFGYAGLKDKFAVTYQYITVKGDIKPLKTDNIEISNIRKTDKMISIGDLIANEFEITLHNYNKKIAPEKTMPNFFGPQRFGKNMNNHVIGRYLIKREWKKAIHIINKNYKKNYKNIRNVPKKQLKFFIHAYQSWIFNKVLGRDSDSIPIIGYDTKSGLMKKLMEKEGISQKDFRIDELNITCRGGKRKAFVNVNVKYEKINNKVKLYFRLPKGSYATVLLMGIC